MEKKYCHADWPISKEGDELYIYNKETEETSVLNITAMQIYNLCTVKTETEISEEILINLNNANEITLDEILEDVKAILANFLKKGLIIEI